MKPPVAVAPSAVWPLQLYRAREWGPERLWPLTMPEKYVPSRISIPSHPWLNHPSYRILHRDAALVEGTRLTRRIALQCTIASPAFHQYFS
jgi:hypothetical protein